jgi:plastocyanin
MKKLLVSFGALSLITLLLVACSGTATNPTSSSSTGNGVAVHMNDTNFVQPSITIQKGQSLNLIDDTAVIHIVTNGTWDNDNPLPGAEPGAPTVNDVMFNGNDSHVIGPFNTAGTFHLFCTIHPGMNLKVIVVP